MQLGDGEADRLAAVSGRDATDRGYLRHMSNIHASDLRKDSIRTYSGRGRLNLSIIYRLYTFFFRSSCGRTGIDGVAWGSYRSAIT